jgi:hypothetical protein
MWGKSRKSTLFQDSWRYVFAGRQKWILWSLLFVLAALVALRIALPSIVKSYVNKTLAGMPDYRGHVNDIGIALWRGAYVIKGVKIETVERNIPVPFFSARRINLSIEWPALFHGSVVGVVEFIDAKINFVQGRSEKDSQNGQGANFPETLKKLFPFRINRFDVKNGEVHFMTFHTTPNVDIHLDNLSVHASNLTNSARLSKTLAASIDAQGTTMGTGALKGHLDIDPYAQKPTFKLTIQLKQVDLPTLNAFFNAYAAVDVASGTFEMYSEVTAAGGTFTGYVKPLFANMHIADLKKDEKNPFRVIWAFLVDLATRILTNRSTDKLGTEIPISGSFDNPKTNIWATIGGILKNAFILALQPGFKNKITLQGAATTQ